jgi:hypothetical protein
MGTKAKTVAAREPKYILSSLRCEGMEEGVSHYLADTSEWTRSEGETEHRPANVIEWPKQSGQMVWYRATYDGMDVTVDACGVAYPARVTL